MIDLFAKPGVAEPMRKPSPAAAMIGRLDWLGRRHPDHACFAHTELQVQYNAGYRREARDCRDARY